MSDRDTTYLSFCGRIDQHSIDLLIQTCTELVAQKKPKIYLLLSSPGGSVDSGIAAYNLLRGMPIELTTHNVGSVDSMGTVLFLAGDQRYACPNSSFMFHGVGFNVSTRMRFEMKNLREKMDSVEDDQRKIGGIIAERTQLAPQQVTELFREAVTRDPQYAIDNGIIQDVRDVVIPEGVEMRHLAARTTKTPSSKRSTKRDGQ